MRESPESMNHPKKKLPIYMFAVILALALIAVSHKTYAATLYYNSDAGDGDYEWTNVNNWWQNPSFTVQASAIPTSADDVFVMNEVDTDGAGTSTVKSLSISNAAIVGPCNSISKMTLVSLNATIVHDTSSLCLGLTLVGTTTFKEASDNNNANIIGTTTFNDHSLNGGTVTGQVTFNNFSTNADFIRGGTVIGNAVFNDLSTLAGGLVTGTTTKNTPGVFQPEQKAYQGGVFSGHYYYLTNTASNTVSIIDTVTDRLVKTLSVPNATNNARLAPVIIGNNLYVASANGVSDIDVNPADAAFNMVVATVSIPSATTNAFFGTKIYFGDTAGGNEYVFDADPTSPSFNTVVATIPIGTNSLTSAVAGNNLYVADQQGNVVKVVDINPAHGTYNTVISTISIGTSSEPFDPIAMGNNVYVIEYLSGKIKVIDANPNDTFYNTVIATINGPAGAFAYGFPFGNYLYVENSNGNTVSVIDANPLDGTYNTIVATINNMTGIDAVVRRGGSQLYHVSNNVSGGQGIYQIDANPSSGTFNTVTASSGSPVVEHIDLLRNKIYTTHYGGLSEMDLSNGMSYVNFSSPHLVSFTSSSTNGTYTTGQTVSINANFDRALNSTSTMTVMLNSGAPVVLNTVSGSTLSGIYTVGAGQSTPDLSVSTVTSALVGDTSTPVNIYNHYDVPLSPELTGDANGNINDTSKIVIASTTATIGVGVNPYQLATVGNYVYVANQGSNTVSVVDSTQNLTIATIPVGLQPYGVTYATSTQEVYVTNLMGNTISVIDASSTRGTYNTVTNTINVGIQPYYVTYYGTKVYATNHVSDTVSVIDTTTHTVIATIPVGYAPLALKVLGNYLYVANFGSAYGGAGQGTVSVINISTNTIATTTIVGSGARGVAVAGSTEVYVTNFNDGTVSVISGATKTVTNTIMVGNQPRGILALGSNVYVENYEDGTISVIATSTHTVTATIKVGSTPAGLAAVGNTIYFSRFTNSELAMLNIFNNTLVAVTAPTVGSSTASSIGASLLTFNSSVINPNGQNTDLRGFDYGFDSSYGATTTPDTDTSFATGTFSYQLTGLVCNRTYHFRSFAHNSTGYTYSADATTTTSVCPVSGGGVFNGGGSSSSDTSGGIVSTSTLKLLGLLPSSDTVGCPASYVCTRAKSPSEKALKTAKPSQRFHSSSPNQASSQHVVSRAPALPVMVKSPNVPDAPVASASSTPFRNESLVACSLSMFKAFISGCLGHGVASFVTWISSLF